MRYNDKEIKENISPLTMEVQDFQKIRHQALSHIGVEVMQVSDFVENSLIDLSDEFQKLVEYSHQQVEDMATACNILQNENIDQETATDKVHKMLTETAEASVNFHQNVNRMIYTMQFQDRARQFMQAISVALDILVKLSEKVEFNPETGNLKENVTLSEDNKTILNQLIEKTAHRELDHRFILRLFTGREEKDIGWSEMDSVSETSEIATQTDVELF